MALETLTKAIEKFPNSGAPYFYRGSLYSLGLKDNAKAAADFVMGSEVAANDDPFKKQNLDILKTLTEIVRTEALIKRSQERARKEEKSRQNAQAILGAVQTITQAVTKTSSPQISQPNTSSRLANTSGSELSTGGTVSAQQNWVPWSTSSCNSGIQFSVINDGPVPGDNTRTYWRIRARSLNGRQASLELFYGESQAEINYAIANSNANAKGESWRVSGVAYLESDKIKQNFPQVDIRNNSNIFVRISNIGWMDSGGRIVENVRCGER